MSKPKRKKSPRNKVVHPVAKVLVYDIETAPLMSFTWGIWEQNVPLNMIERDWFILSWSAKWLGDPDSKIMYMDQRNSENIEDDKKLLERIWKLLDEAQVVITQNGKSFDEKKLNARFILNGMGPPSSYEHIDTKRIASRKFAFTSNKLEYLTEKLCKKKKMKHKKFPGFELWKECLKGNKAAFKEMEAYNKMDVLSLEELYNKLQPWAKEADFQHITGDVKCACGSTHFHRKDKKATKAGLFQRYTCQSCGSIFRDKTNLREKGFSKKLLVKE